MLFHRSLFSPCVRGGIILVEFVLETSVTGVGARGCGCPTRVVVTAYDVHLAVETGSGAVAEFEGKIRDFAPFGASTSELFNLLGSSFVIGSPTADHVNGIARARHAPVQVHMVERWSGGPRVAGDIVFLARLERVCIFGVRRTRSNDNGGHLASRGVGEPARTELPASL